jgi:hypothetical protein
VGDEPVVEIVPDTPVIELKPHGWEKSILTRDIPGDIASRNAAKIRKGAKV